MGDKSTIRAGRNYSAVVRRDRTESLDGLTLAQVKQTVHKYHWTAPEKSRGKTSKLFYETSIQLLTFTFFFFSVSKF